MPPVVWHWGLDNDRSWVQCENWTWTGRSIKMYVKLTNTEDNARSDVSTRGIFSSHEVTFFDVRISNPNAKSTYPSVLLKYTRKMKLRRWNHMETGSFKLKKACWFPWSTRQPVEWDLNGPRRTKESQSFLYKRRMRYSEVINHIRTMHVDCNQRSKRKRKSILTWRYSIKHIV